MTSFLPESLPAVPTNQGRNALTQRRVRGRVGCEQYELLLQAERWTTPVVVRLRKLLKIIGRVYGFKVLRVVPAAEATAATVEQVMAKDEQ